MLSEEQVIAAIRAGAGIDAQKSIGVDEELKALGVDSLDLFNALLEIEALTGTKVPDQDVDKMTTVRAILDYFSANA